MKYFINSIEDEIEKQEQKKQINLIKLEGIESPIIYKEICKYFKNSNLDFEAKLSREKFEEFKKEYNNNDELEILESIKFLENNNFVDFDGAMTKWRNGIATDNKNATTKLVLLMGTELVQDKGGLADFYTINPQTIIKSLKKDKYYAYFKEVIENSGVNIKDSNEVKKAINRIFDEIFSIFPIDLIKVSNIAENLEGETFKIVDEIIEFIFDLIPKYWDLPCMNNIRPSFNKLKGKSAKAADVIKKAYNFVNRKEYKTSYPNKGKINKIKSKLEEFKKNNSIEDDLKFPVDTEVFDDFEEFSNVLIDFIKGINFEENRKKLMQIDFAIVNEILKLKVKEEGSSKGKKEKVNKISGNPIEIYSEIILDSLNEYKKENNNFPNEIIFNIESITLGNCIDNDELLEEYKSISAYLGGILDFINKENFEFGDENLEIKYLDDKDPFSNRRLEIKDENDAVIEGIESIDISRSKNINVASKINIKVLVCKKEEAGNGEYLTTNLYENEWQWVFNPINSWKTQFLLCKNIINNELCSVDNIPLGWYCENLNELIGFENEDEFLNKLLESKIKIITSEIEEKVKFISSVDNQVTTLKYLFKEMSEDIFKNGFFYEIKNEDSKIYKFIFKYYNLIKFVNLNFKSFKTIEKEKIFILLNLFNIGKSNKDGIEDKEYDNVIMPPIHPIMLEKLVDQQIFIRKSIKDILLSSIDKKVDSSKLKNKIIKMIQLSEITTGADALFGNKNLLTSEKVIANYAIYEDLDYKSEEILNGYNSLIIEDDEINISDILKSSPKSLIISENIIDYIKIFPTRADGIKITMLNPESLQYIVSGINEVVKNFSDEGINIKLTIIRDKNEKNGVDYLKYWLDNKLSEKDNINIKTFVINKDFESKHIVESLDDTLKQQDIIFVGNILKTKSVELREVFEGDYEENNDASKYPMVFPPLPLSKSANKRAINITQSQFDLEYEHTQLLNKIKNPSSKECEFKVVKEIAIDERKNELLQNIHNSAKWVVCMDESIDKEILSNKNKGHIVGFTTGKGNYGELNVTVSARNDILEDIKIKLKNRLRKHFRSWSNDENTLDLVADFCIKTAEELDGGKILKALNSSDFAIHSFLSYIITLQYLNIPSCDDEYVVRILLNLDSHMHWFEELVINENDEDKIRPDLLLLEIKKDDFCDEYGNLKINATVIECKMGNEDNVKKNKAITQVKKGILSLSKIWDKSIETSKRYWSNQLYRALIFSKINIDEDDEKYERVINKIEGVLNGRYKINWSGKVFAYWINSREITCIDNCVYDIDDVEHITSDIRIIECGQLYIKKMLLPEEKREENQVFEEEVIEDLDDMDSLFEKLEADNIDKEKGYIEEVEVRNQLDNKEKEIYKENNNELNNENVEILSGKNGDYKELKDIRVLVGKEERTNKNIYWEYGNKDLNNRHLFISGRSGTGKTYCIQCLLYELTKQGVPAIIFDYTDGFREDKLDPIFREFLGERLKQKIVMFEKFDINPFKRQKISISGFTKDEEDIDIARRIAETFKSVYSLGDQQFSNLYTATRNGLEKFGDKMDFSILAQELEELGTKEAKTTLSKIQVFLDTKAFDNNSEFSWEKLIKSDGDVFIVQLTGYTRDVQTLLTTLILWDIWNYARRFGSEDNPFVVVLDEAQNLDHSETSPSGYILTEGRKFGVSGWYATQFLKGQMDIDEIGRLQQAAQKIYFAPPETEIKDIARIIDSDTKEAKIWEEKLKFLGKGECVISGQMKQPNGERLIRYSPKIIKVSSLEERKNGNL